MSLFNFPITDVKFSTFDGTEITKKTVYSNLESLPEEEAESFFADAQNSGTELIVWPVKAENVLTEEDEVYNEELLALLRKNFKVAENFNVEIALLPLTADKNNSEIDSDLVTASMKHTARRLKTCKKIIGFVFPESDGFKNEKVRQTFADELLQKHEHYKFLF